MRRASILAFLSAALLAPVVGHSAPIKAAPLPTCAGRDILADMKTSDPSGYAKVRAAADAVPNTGAILWRVEKEGRAPSYLFGTIHSTDERVTTLSPAIVAAFDSAKTAAFEIFESDLSKLETSLKEFVAAKGFYAKGNGLNDVLTPAEINTLRETLVAEGFPAQAVHLLRPWFAGLSLALPSCEKKRLAAGVPHLDKQLERNAVAQGKRVVGLETFQFQMDALSGLPEGTQVSMLKAGVATISLRDDASEVLHRAYLSRDLATSLPFSKFLFEKVGQDPAAVEAFERDINTKRNYGMRRASLPLLEQGGAFIAVGALHLLGKEGLVELFREAGYMVTPIE